MAPWLWAALGAVVVVGTFVDALWTTVAPRGAGPVSGRVGRAVYAGAKALGGGRAPGWTGPAVLVAGLVLWVGLLWAGWVAVFSADAHSLVDPGTGAPANLGSRAYAVGTYVSTLGLGAVWAPGTAGWGVLSVVVSVSGFALLTLVVTYVLQVVGAVTAARQLAGAVHALGPTPTAIVARNWTGSGFDGLGQHLANLTPMVEAHGRRHGAYPALHFFQSAERRTSAPVMLAVLDEALLLLADGVAPRTRLAPAKTDPLRETLGAYLDTLGESFVDTADVAPATPDLGAVADVGVPVVEAAAFARAVAEAWDRRCRLLGLVRDSGRGWSSVTEE